MSDKTDNSNIIEGRDATGWHEQWLALKQEIDVLNPTVDSLKAKLSLAEQQSAQLSAALETAKKQTESAISERDAFAAERDSLNSALAQKHGEASSLTAEVQRLKALNQRHRDNVTACFNAIGPLHKALGDSLAAE